MQQTAIKPTTPILGFMPLCVLWLMLNAVDLLATNACLGSGHSELMPAMRLAMDGGVGLALKTGLGVAVPVVLFAINKTHLLLCLNICMGAIVIWNLTVWNLTAWSLA